MFPFERDGLKVMTTGSRGGNRCRTKKLRRFIRGPQPRVKVRKSTQPNVQSEPIGRANVVIRCRWWLDLRPNFLTRHPALALMG